MTETETETPEPTVQPDDSRDVRAYLHWGALVGLGLLAAAATLQLYGSATRAIRLWVTSDFQPVFVATFNLVVLLVAAIGISIVLKRMAGDDGEGE